MEGKWAFVPRLNSVLIAGLGRKNSAAAPKWAHRDKGVGGAQRIPWASCPWPLNEPPGHQRSHQNVQGATRPSKEPPPHLKSHKSVKGTTSPSKEPPAHQRSLQPIQGATSPSKESPAHQRSQKPIQGVTSPFKKPPAQQRSHQSIQGASSPLKESSKGVSNWSVPMATGTYPGASPGATIRDPRLYIYTRVCMCSAGVYVPLEFRAEPSRCSQLQHHLSQPFGSAVIPLKFPFFHV